MFDLVWMIPALPLAGVLLNGILGRKFEARNKSLVHLIACGAVGISFLITLVLFLRMLDLPPDKRLVNYTWFTWMASGNFQAAVAYQIDPISMFMCMFVTGVGFLIHVYSIGYMWHDEGSYSRYFAYLNLFMFSMINLVLADNFLLMFLGWEGVGVCSYLLIAYWFTDIANAIAGKKAFITNRIGDFFFAIGLFLLFTNLGQHGIWSLKFSDVFTHASLISPDMITIICLLFFLGCTAKSAQIPLYIWLPDAMAGPTPVSALIHAATMVTAGVYFVARCNILYSMSAIAMGVVAVVGALTALLAASIALTQNDIKRVLAYSTVSQLGYMFLGLGVGAFAAGLFHVLTHAFFKALLFMCAGSVIHAMSGEQDMRFMGGLRNKLPITYKTMLIGTLAIAGFPGMSGFFSKDEILWQVFNSGLGAVLWPIAVLTAAMTAFYMFRLIFMTFFNDCRASEDVKHHIHESPKSMTVPLMILAVLSVIGGLIGVPAVLGGSNLVEHFLDPAVGLGAGKLLQAAAGHAAAAAHGPHEAVAHASHELELGLMLFTTVIVFIGIFVSYMLYMRKRDIPDRLAENNPVAYRLVFNKWFVDEIYEKLVLNPIHSFSMFLWKGVDIMVIDWLVNGTAEFFMQNGVILKGSQSGYLQRYAVSFLVGVVVLVAYYMYGH